MEVVVNKIRKGGNFKAGVFACKDCGEIVERRGSSHSRCAECSAESILNIRLKKRDRYFPVIDESYHWLPAYFLEGGREEEKKRYHEGVRRDLLRELSKPIPCSACSLEIRCVTKLLMCRQYYDHINSQKKNPPMAPGRRDPRRYWYVKAFPDDPAGRTPA